MRKFKPCLAGVAQRMKHSMVNIRQIPELFCNFCNAGLARITIDLFLIEKNCCKKNISVFLKYVDSGYDQYIAIKIIQLEIQYNIYV